MHTVHGKKVFLVSAEHKKVESPSQVSTWWVQLFSQMHSISLYIFPQPCVPLTCSSCGRTWQAFRAQRRPWNTRASTWLPTAPTLPHTRPPRSHLRSPIILCQMDRTLCTLQRETGETLSSIHTQTYTHTTLMLWKHKVLIITHYISLILWLFNFFRTLCVYGTIGAHVPV